MGLVLTLIALAALAASAGIWFPFKILAGLFGLYIVLAAASVVLVRHSRAQFVRIVSKLPRLLRSPFFVLRRFAGDGSLKSGSMAPDFELQTYDRKSSVRLSSFRGHKPVVLMFVFRPLDGPWIPRLNRFYRTFSDMAGDAVAVFAVLTGDARVAVPGSAGHVGMEVRALVDDAKNTAAITYTGWPSWLYLIDRDGRVAYKGSRPRELLERLRAVSTS